MIEAKKAGGQAAEAEPSSSTGAAAPAVADEPMPDVVTDTAGSPAGATPASAYKGRGGSSVLASARNFVVKQLLMLTIFSLILPCTSVLPTQPPNSFT